MIVVGSVNFLAFVLLVDFTTNFYMIKWSFELKRFTILIPNIHLVSDVRAYLYDMVILIACLIRIIGALQNKWV